MAYHTLSQDSGGDAEARRAEASKICSMLEDDLEIMTEKERGFLESVAEGGPVTPKMLFWLRDIKEKYL